MQLCNCRSKPYYIINVGRGLMNNILKGVRNVLMIEIAESG